MSVQKRITILLSLLAFSCIATNAAISKTVNHNGIFYDVDVDATNVSVTKPVGVNNPYEHYKGTVNIPTSITLEGKTYSVTKISSQAFRSQSGLTMVVIPKTIEEIADRAFWGCVNLKSVALASNGVLTSIEKEAFYGCTKISSITLPNSLVYLGESAFHDCESLKSVKYGNSIEVIDHNAFQGCQSLTEFIAPASLKRIGNYAFWNCANIKKVVMNDGLEEIGNDAFLQCSGLDDLSLGNTVKKIGYEAFRWCLGLKSVVIPNSVEEMGYSTFRYCTGLENVTLGNALKEIPAYCFEQAIIKSIEIPNSVTAIGLLAFSECPLEDIKWGNSVETIGEESFYKTNIETLNLPEPLKCIRSNAFRECGNLTEITMPATMLEIQSGAFLKCKNLKHVYLHALTPPSIDRGSTKPFERCNNPVIVHLYEGLKDLYESSIEWSENIKATNEKGKIELVDDMPALKVESISIEGAPYYCGIGETGVATATIYPVNAFSRELSWSSSDDTILYIDEFSGFYVGFQEGTVTITATATDGSGVTASATVHVTDVSGIETVNLNTKSNTIFNIQGQKLSVPMKGINIINGKKVLKR